MPSVVPKISAYARLLRVSNAPTAVADILMGHAVATGRLTPAWDVALLCVASLCVYHFGMALNDIRDAARDAEDGRGRPIPAGDVRRGEAIGVAGALVTIGLLAAAAVSLAAALIASCLVAVVVAYNSRLKRTAAGPLLMGGCRALNGLLGMSPALTSGVALAVAPGTLAYVAGLTLFARDEAVGGRRDRLAAAVFVALVGVVWLAAAPWALPMGRWISVSPVGWWVLWSTVVLHVVGAFALAVVWPTPKRVQRAIGRGIRAIVVIDAALAMGYAGPYYGATVLLMAPLVMLLARFAPQT